MVKVKNYLEWRNAARGLLREGVRPEEVVWASADDAQELLFEPQRSDDAAPVDSDVRVPRAFLPLAESVARHSDAKRWNLLYRVVWRLTHGERHLLQVETDDDVAALNAMRRAVEKDIYRMRQFVRFRKVEGEEGERFVAWYEPEHHTLDANGKFFVERFGSMRWAILTPEASLIWDLNKLKRGPGAPRSQAPQEDELEDLWRLYYRTIYNPARMKLNAMRAQLPVNCWNNLPEARTIPELVRLSRGRVQQMTDEQPRSAAEFIPAGAGLEQLREAVHKCGACALCPRATQAVFGEGNPEAQIMLVGEQPGDEEDRKGRPFVGPAGQVLDGAIREAGLERPQLYLTNAVKAFKFEERGKRRIHQTPRNLDISVCRPWLMAEIEAVRPRVIVCLGASAAQSVLGRRPHIGAERGKAQRIGDRQVVLTYHPSAVLRAPDEAMRQELYAMLVSDLKLAKQSATGATNQNAA